MKERLKRYALIGVDINDNLIRIKEYVTILELDNFTRQFKDKNDAIAKLKELTNRNIKDLAIENRYNSKFDKIDYSHDIIFKENIIPEDNELLDLYFKYLIEDRTRLKTSTSYYRPILKRGNVFSIPEDKIRENINTRIKDYKSKRDIYFELLKHSKIKLDSGFSKQERYFNSLIKNIDNYPDYNYYEGEYYDKYDFIPKVRRRK